jgi:hypothetical protein
MRKMFSCVAFYPRFVNRRELGVKGDSKERAPNFLFLLPLTMTSNAFAGPWTSLPTPLTPWMSETS